MISVKINNGEVKNPLAKLVISVFALVMFILILAVLLVVFLPIIWFSVAIVLGAAFLFLVRGPKIIEIWRIVVKEKKDQAIRKRLR